ncbi:LacI family DNA-binding transcriptional regulator [Catenovulum agarivorans]|uniref:LacI family DNA-binding transcriptional regulator n=1 Tax=Catenovulum agarivorans TaxID=1172192 RepID=UPI0003151F14|nr:substrate-binding domain-containing protein [Catenovulum agarivorans]
MSSIDMQHIADLAGVSRATVSRALNDSSLVNEQTKNKIKLIAQEHNYVINEAARNFRLNQSQTVTVVMMTDPLVNQQSFDPFFMEMIASLLEALAKSELDMLVSQEPITDAAAFRNSRIYRQSLGLIVIGQGQGHEQLNELASDKLPMVVWGVPTHGQTYHLVSTDDKQGGKQATQHLINKGCKNIAFFGDKASADSELRYQGYCAALNEAGLAINAELDITVPFVTDKAKNVINAFLDAKPKVDGIVCCSDLIAMSAMSCLQEHSLKVPSDVAVIGYDGLSFTERTSPPLSTINQDIRQCAYKLVDCLVGLINGKQVENTLADVQLIERKSTQRN